MRVLILCTTPLNVFRYDTMSQEEYELKSQRQGARLRKYEAYSIYDECLRKKRNAVYESLVHTLFLRAVEIDIVHYTLLCSRIIHYF
jgi:hypothetical protein